MRLTMSSCRSVYRMIELIDGFNGKIIQTEIYFSTFRPPAM